MSSLRLALAQLNLTVGDLDGNADRIADAVHRARAWMADLVAVPELAIPGYPPEDLLLKSGFVAANRRTLDRLAPRLAGVVALVGFVDADQAGRLYNAAAAVVGGRITAVYRKQYLPNYGVFDEQRYFTPGAGSLVLRVGGLSVGVTICEDLWEEAPCRMLRQAGAGLVVNLSASPYHAGKGREREALFSRRARRNRLAVAYCNLVGGQDELVFDGASVMLDAGGCVFARGAQFREDLVLADVPAVAALARPGRRVAVATVPRPLPVRAPLPAAPATLLPAVEEVYEALQLGVRDYARKNGFHAAVLGLSGGIDSALTACLATDALGPDHVVGMVMPSRYSSAGTQEDARRVGRALGIQLHELGIEPVFEACLRVLRLLFAGRPADIAEQNLQARIRGNLLMALSNKFGWLVLTTGNKSEMATGYCTLYGDMAGGFAVIKDVPKTLVYRLARFRNRRGPGAPIPPRVLRRAPTAELAPGQTDQDTLPPYDILDRILKAYVEDDRSLSQILAANRVRPETVARVIRMVDRSEYKRRQGPPGIKITPKAFGRDRRMPITNRYQQG